MGRRVAWQRFDDASTILDMAEPEELSSPGAGVSGSSDTLLRLRAEAVDWREVEGQVVALDRAASTYLAINPSGTHLWPALVEGATRDRLIEILVGAFDVDSSRAAADVDAFVSTLHQRDLLER